MTVVVDTSFVFALFARSDRHHSAAAAWYGRSDEALVTTPAAIAEMDHLLRRTGPVAAGRLVIANLASRALECAWWDGAVDDCWAIADARPDVGIVDASLVALAAHRRTTRIATFDERHFRSLRPLTGEPAFTLVPADGD